MKHRPLPQHGEAFNAARAAECAAKEGRFALMHNVLLLRQRSLGVIPYITLAAETGLTDQSRFAQCFNDPDNEANITRDVELANRLGNRPVPLVIVDGSVLARPPSASELIAEIETALQKRGIPTSLPRPWVIGQEQSLIGSTRYSESVPPSLAARIDTFLAAFANASAAEMIRFFADTVLFDGDRQLGMRIPGATRRADDDRVAPEWMSLAVTASALANTYEAYLKRLDLPEVQALLSWSRPTLYRVIEDYSPYRHARRGDLLYDLHWRTALGTEDDGMRGAVLFVIRLVAGEYRIVGHFADY